jgi:NADPH-dependent glutamate synthase beta subunit-like oxidoreductase
MSTIANSKATGRLSQIHGEKCWPMVDKISPCEEACPLGTDIPSYVMATAQGKFDDALRIIRDTNPFPSVCGYVCHQPCEAVCNRALIDDAIAIRALKRYVADYSAGAHRGAEKAQKTKSERIAVVGSGPAGLTAAYSLVRKGYSVTVLEAAPVAGGWLTNGIPEFILPAKAAESDIRYIRGSGVVIRTNVRVGKDISLEGLGAKGYKAILLASGAQKGAKLKIPGAELKNVLSAVDLLRDTRHGKRILMQGRVVVIGGGAVAMDAARTALRLGSRDVHIACLECRADMPAWKWEIEAAEKEGVKIHVSLAPQKFSKLQDSSGLNVEFRRVAFTNVDSEGRISWKLMEGQGGEYHMDADFVIVAIGQVSDTSYIQDNRIKVNNRGAFEVDDNMQTGSWGIFATGDAVNVRGTVTEAIALGQKAADCIDSYLRGVSKDRRSEKKDILEIDAKLTSPWLARKARWTVPSLNSRDAVRTFSPALLGYSEEQAVEEAKRCLNCRMCANCIYGRGQICYETAMRLLK